MKLNLFVLFLFLSVEIAQLTSCDSGIAETPETDDSVSTLKLITVSIRSIFYPRWASEVTDFIFVICFIICLSVSEPQHSPAVAA